MNRLTPAQAEQQSWYLDGYRRGHTVAEVVARASKAMDDADARAGRGALLERAPPWIVSPIVEGSSFLDRLRSRYR